MVKFRFANKVAIAGATFLSTAGAVLSVILLVRSLKGGFDWYDFLPAFLYILCFVTLGVYTFSRKISSKTAFRSVLASYGVVVAVTGVILPPVYPHGTDVLFLVFSVLIIFGLIAFEKNWKNVGNSQILITIIYVAEVLGAFAHLAGDPMLTDGNLSAKLICFIRPVIISTIAVCYLARMYERSKKQA